MVTGISQGSISDIKIFFNLQGIIVLEDVKIEAKHWQLHTTMAKFKPKTILGNQTKNDFVE